MTKPHNRSLPAHNLLQECVFMETPTAPILVSPGLSGSAPHPSGPTPLPVCTGNQLGYLHHQRTEEGLFKGLKLLQSKMVANKF